MNETQITRLEAVRFQNAEGVTERGNTCISREQQLSPIDFQQADRAGVVLGGCLCVLDQRLDVKIFIDRSSEHFSKGCLQARLGFQGSVCLNDLSDRVRGVRRLRLETVPTWVRIKGGRCGEMARTGAPYSDASRANALSAASSFFAYLDIVSERLVWNPFAAVHRPVIHQHAHRVR
ncbi:hypothetical protein ACFV3N_05645 [Streptomyces bauhiniae]|uniref:hypothetical protein n=1 Tax=Streptomyces bauhiniae TaxID=2340725 RepID=UPI003652FA99